MFGNNVWSMLVKTKWRFGHVAKYCVSNILSSWQAENFLKFSNIFELILLIPLNVCDVAKMGQMLFAKQNNEKQNKALIVSRWFFAKQSCIWSMSMSTANICKYRTCNFKILGWLGYRLFWKLNFFYELFNREINLG